MEGKLGRDGTVEPVLMKVRNDMGIHDTMGRRQIGKGDCVGKLIQK